VVVVALRALGVFQLYVILDALCERFDSDWQELARRQRAACGVAPALQRLNARYAPCLQVEYGLVQQAGATGEKLFRADSGFWNGKLIATLEQAGWGYSISVRLQFWVPAAIKVIPESAW
jgi:hypothetical protein